MAKRRVKSRVNPKSTPELRRAEAESRAWLDADITQLRRRVNNGCEHCMNRIRHVLNMPRPDAMVHDLVSSEADADLVRALANHTMLMITNADMHDFIYPDDTVSDGEGA